MFAMNEQGHLFMCPKSKTQDNKLQVIKPKEVLKKEFGSDQNFYADFGFLENAIFIVGAS